MLCFGFGFGLLVIWLKLMVIVGLELDCGICSICGWFFIYYACYLVVACFG